jgi:hypothetical protein
MSQIQGGSRTRSAELKRTELNGTFVFNGNITDIILIVVYFYCSLFHMSILMCHYVFNVHKYENSVLSHFFFGLFLLCVNLSIILLSVLVEILLNFSKLPSHTTYYILLPNIY